MCDTECASRGLVLDKLECRSAKRDDLSIVFASFSFFVVVDVRRISCGKMRLAFYRFSKVWRDVSSHLPFV